MPTLANVQGGSLVANPLGSITSGLEARARLDEIQRLQQQRQLAADTQSQVNQLTQQLLSGQNVGEARTALAGLGTLGIEAIQNIQGISQADQEAAQAREEQRLDSVVKGAAEVQGLGAQQQLATLLRRRTGLIEQGISTEDTDEVIGLLQAGDVEGANNLINQAVSLGQQAGILEPVQDLATEKEFKEAELDIKRQTLGIRREESRQRDLDRALARETNQLNRDKLQQQLDASRAASDQAKRDVQFEADNAVGSVDESIGTIDRLLEGEGLESAAGIGSLFFTTPGSKAANFEAVLETLQSQAFLTQVEKMKGLGALSENEGKKLGAAIGSLSLSMSDEALRSELTRIRGTLNNAKDKISTKFNVQTPSAADAPADTGQQVGRFTVEVE